jgi:hypothetical protein
MHNLALQPVMVLPTGARAAHLRMLFGSTVGKRLVIAERRNPG